MIPPTTTSQISNASNILDIIEYNICVYYNKICKYIILITHQKKYFQLNKETNRVRELGNQTYKIQYLVICDILVIYMAYILYMFSSSEWKLK